MTPSLTSPTKRIRPTDGGADPKAFGGATSNATGTGPAAPLQPTTLKGIIDTVTTSYLAALDPGAPPHPWMVEKELVSLTNKELTLENLGRSTGNKMTLLQGLSHVQVARILTQLHRVVRLIPSHDEEAMPSDEDSLVIYRPQSGIYVRSNDAIAAVAAKYSSGGVQFLKDVIAALRVYAPLMRHGTSRDWAAVANGDYHRATSELHPFSPERVFLSRVPVDYVPTAQNIVIHNDDDGTDWDVDSGILAIADGDSGTEQLLWELFSAVSQPNVRTNKAVALHNPVGNNGKGTVLQLLRGLAGESNTLSASVATLAKDTTLPLLTGKSLVVSDENATNDFVKNAETIKVLATRDSFFVNPKYQQPYNATFEGTQVHCLNALPRFGDHSESMWRRWLFIPLTAEFEGRERKYIKDDYLHRAEVLQYVLRRALEMKFTGFTETEATKKLLNDAKLHNDAARQFWAEYKQEFLWDLLPLEFLYELFKAWFARNKPAGRMMDRSNFDESIRSAVKELGGDWVDLGPRKPKKASVHMIAKEPLIADYGLDQKWNSIDRKKQFREVLFRDRVALVRARANAAVALPAPNTPAPLHLVAVDPKPREDLCEVERLVAEDLALWERRTVEDDGITDLSHVREHAAMRRLGTMCGGCKVQPQLRYDDAVISHSRDLDAALFAARAELEAQAA